MREVWGGRGGAAQIFTCLALCQSDPRTDHPHALHQPGKTRPYARSSHTRASSTSVFTAFSISWRLTHSSGE